MRGREPRIVTLDPILKTLQTTISPETTKVNHYNSCYWGAYPLVAQLSSSRDLELPCQLTQLDLLLLLLSPPQSEVTIRT